MFQCIYILSKLFDCSRIYDMFNTYTKRGEWCLKVQTDTRENHLGFQKAFKGHYGEISREVQQAMIKAVLGHLCRP